MKTINSLTAPVDVERYSRKGLPGYAKAKRLVRKIERARMRQMTLNEFHQFHMELAAERQEQILEREAAERAFARFIYKLRKAEKAKSASEVTQNRRKQRLASQMIEFDLDPVLPRIEIVVEGRLLASCDLS